MSWGRGRGWAEAAAAAAVAVLWCQEVVEARTAPATPEAAVAGRAVEPNCGALSVPLAAPA
ncbi:MAG: hypothetical protein QWI73_06530 [Alphaproteobacteria bacterium]|nr:hypothetical protein [Alphaproteobacteria bacterium]